MVEHHADIALADPSGAQAPEAKEHPTVVQLPLPDDCHHAHGVRPHAPARGILTAVLIAIPFWIAIIYVAFKIL